MKITVDGEVFEFRQDRITNVEGMAIERATGLLFMEWAEKLSAGSMLAQTALVWLVKKRVQPSLKFDEVEYTSLDIEVEEEAHDPKADAEPASVTTD